MRRERVVRRWEGYILVMGNGTCERCISPRVV